MNVAQDALLYLGGSFIGCLWEHIIFGKSLCGDTFTQKLLGFCLPLSHIYGIGVLIVKYLYILFHIKHSLSLLLTAFIITIVITLFEIIVGQISFAYNEYKTWHYEYLSFANGYGSVLISCGWFVGVLLLICVFEKLNLFTK